MKQYTVAVVFDHTGRSVLLMLKNRPKWQEGKFNFPGGKVESEETPIQCVVREFKEECGLLIEPERWNYTGIFSGSDEACEGNYYYVHVFATKTTEHESPYANEDQEVYWFLNGALPDNCITNIRWIIPLVLNNVHFFNVEYLP